MNAKNIATIIMSTANAVAEDYFTTGKSMNESIQEFVDDGTIENVEIAKRICEIANKKVYQLIFNAPGTNRKNIVFDLATIEDIDTTQNGDGSMNLSRPDNYKNISAIEKTASFSVVGDGEESVFEKLAHSNLMKSKSKQFNNAANQMSTYADQCKNNVCSMLTKIAHNIKLMVGNGDTAEDIGTIMVRSVADLGDSAIEKTAALVDIELKKLESKGHKIQRGITKIATADLVIRKNDNLDIVRQLHIEMEKQASAETLTAVFKDASEHFLGKSKESK